MRKIITITITETGHTIQTADCQNTMTLAEDWIDTFHFKDVPDEMLSMFLLLRESTEAYKRDRHIGWIPVIQHILNEIAELETAKDVANPLNHSDDDTPRLSPFLPEDDNS